MKAIFLAAILASVAGAATAQQTLPLQPLRERLRTIEVQVNGKGDLQMTLPKAMIDGVNLVISGGDQFYFKEIDANSTSTTIQINIPRQVESIKIIATMVVPEFPLSTIGVIAVGFAAIAVIGRTRLMKGFYSERLDQTSEVQFSPSET